eukprot:CAMPEP_0171255988 /NCGR_PEP_ID=MMETSP0790-20130122/53058_1 /TAXON_ID=2925 /ORGANISM="Alexandrium catenella, Strain OF101" /LENGTH=66 /DNA_ID=CAMNT_0011723973 /DNA_START=49 /DNA_END=246 /DNA_ORIENTATION=-
MAERSSSSASLSPPPSPASFPARLAEVMTDGGMGPRATTDLYTLWVGDRAETAQLCRMWRWRWQML